MKNETPKQKKPRAKKATKASVIDKVVAEAKQVEQSALDSIEQAEAAISRMAKNTMLSPKVKQFLIGAGLTVLAISIAVIVHACLYY